MASYLRPLAFNLHFHFPGILGCKSISARRWDLKSAFLRFTGKIACFRISLPKAASQCDKNPQPPCFGLVFDRIGRFGVEDKDLDSDSVPSHTIRLSEQSMQATSYSTTEIELPVFEPKLAH